MADPDDTLLVRLAQQGDRRAIESLVVAHLPFVRRTARRVLGSSADVDDIVQEAMMSALAALPAFAGRSRLSTWLYPIVLRTALKHGKRRGREIAGDGVEPATGATQDPEARLIARDSLSRANQILSQLPPEQREAFILFEVEGLPLAEIAACTDAPLQTVATRLRTARLALLAGLRSEHDDMVASAEKSS